MYYFDISCDKFSHSGLYTSIEECMQLVEAWEEIYTNVRWNISPAYRYNAKNKNTNRK